MASKRKFDILCVGEALIDFIAEEAETPLAETKNFQRHLGGSPTNVAMHMSRLGLRVKMAATVGKDGLGAYILKQLKEAEIDTENILEEKNQPTSVIFVGRTAGTPEFIAYRGADVHISEKQIPNSLLQQSKIFHTTCFALSKNPARETILKKAEMAKRAGCELSIDINYSEKIWPERDEAMNAIKNYCSLQPLVKVSQDDMDRLFGARLPHEEIFKKLHSFGAKSICLTLGKEGVKLSEKGKPILERAALKIDEIVDATGAGDAFWSGFLFGKIKDFPAEKCVDIALKVAALKLQTVGTVPDYSEIISSTS